MSSKENEYKEMFLAEALDNYEELNQLFTDLEKDTSNKRAVDAIFRITHTLKGNAMGMGFEEIADLSHVMEDVFSVVKEGKLSLDSNLFDSLFKANDKLGELIEALKNGSGGVKYKGIRTKLNVILNKVREDLAPKDNEPSIESSATTSGPSIKKEIDTEEVKSTRQPASNYSLDTLVTDITTQNGVLQPVEEEEVIVATMEEESDEDSSPKIAFSDLVQIPVRKLDSLLNLVGELIIERDSLTAQNRNNSSDFTRLQRITSDLQYSVMDVRLVQIGFLFKKFSRIVRDVANIEGKKVDLDLKGTDIEIDRNILKIMSDSLVHLVRNAVSHGIEKAEERVKNNKPQVGRIILNAMNEKDTVIIQVQDDGHGIDPAIIKQKAIEKKIVTQEYADALTKEELVMLIFEPGFSKNDEITEVSGRGVGMDVVKRATESIGGKILVDSEIGNGTTVSLHLPSSMAVKGALLFELGEQEYAVPLTFTEAVISLKKKEIHKVGQGLMSKYLGKTISIVFLKDVFDLEEIKGISKEGTLHQTYDSVMPSQKLDVMVVSHGNKYVGLVVDKLLQQKEIVEKTLSKPLDHIEIISGATILGNGNVCLVLDIARVLNILFKEKMGQPN